MDYKCICCGKKPLIKDEIGISRKMLGKKSDLYCIECIAEFLDTTTDVILDKIEEFKEEGCVEFQ